MTKNVLVVGDTSYIGKAFMAYAQGVNVHGVSARENAWENAHWENIHTVLHCAGLAHVPQKKHMQSQYHHINCKLAVEVATYSKAKGVGQFIFLSSMAAHGNPKAGDMYAQSKLAAEKALEKLNCPSFKVCIIRPPMVYGPGCKGNFPKLVKLVHRLPAFPNVPQQQRSMIYIDNLSQCILQLIINNQGGLHLPQNTEYVNTTHLAQLIAQYTGKNLRTTTLFNPFIHGLKGIVPPISKLFGNLVYPQESSNATYHVVPFEESVRRSVEHENS